MGSRTHARRDRRAQSGASLLEVLVAIVLIGIIVGGASAGIILLIRTTAQANDAARANVLVAGFGEIVKELPYHSCTTGDSTQLAATYNSEFIDFESEVAADRRLLAGTDEASVDDVDVQLDCASGDPGVQTINYEVTSRSARRTAQVTKRDPNFADGLHAEFTATLITWAEGPDDDLVGDPLVVFEMDASLSGPQPRIVSYSYDCDEADAANPVIVVSDPTSADAICEYAAPATAGETKTIVLTVMDSRGGTARSSVVVTLPRARSPRAAPVAVISADPTCAPVASRCIANPSRVVSFDGGASSSAEGRIESYEWTFGDPGSGESNRASGASVQHTYSRSGSPGYEFVVTLTVTDELGIEGSTTRTIFIERPGPPPPTASFTYSPIPAVARQTVRFDAGGSAPGGPGAPVVGYAWNFGDGATSPEVAPRHTYENPGTFNVSLTVTDSNGTTSTATAQVVITELLPPTDPSVNFRLTGSNGCFLGFQLWCSAWVDFAWINPTYSATDRLFFEIEMSHHSGICFAFNTESRRVQAGPPGTAQTFRYTFRGASDVCLTGQYNYRVRTIRETAEDQTIISPYGPQVRWSPG